jgi:hypothetical protein
MTRPRNLHQSRFDDVTPNSKRDISSWLYDYAVERAPIIDNRAKDVDCYDTGYTFVEKLQTVSTKFRRQQETKEFPVNFMRHYYDIYRLLERPEVQAFIGTTAYRAHKEKRFRSGDNPDLIKNDAFVLLDPETRRLYKAAYDASTALYYGNKPTFEQILEQIRRWIARL